MNLPRHVILVGGLALLLVAWAGAETPTYVGAKKCRACHLKQFQPWEQTKMAKSFELLRAGVASGAKKKANLDPLAGIASVVPFELAKLARRRGSSQSPAERPDLAAPRGF